MSEIASGRQFRTCLVLLLSCWSSSTAAAQGGGPAAGAKPAPAKAPVEFTEARSYRVGNTLRLPGSARSPRKAEVASSTAGLVKEIHFREGQSVAAGDLLASLDMRALEIRRETLRARLAEASVRVESSQSKLRRASELSAAKLISTEQFDEARFEYQSQISLVSSLKFEIAEVDHAISLSEIRAPFRGIVSRKLSEVGQWLKVGDPLLTMVSLERVEVVVELPESYVGAVRPGLTARVEFEALGGAVSPGVVTAILPEASNDARTFPVQVSIENPKLSIRAGMLGVVEFQPLNAKPATIVPKDAVVRKETGHFVYVIGPSDKVVETRVSPRDGAGQWVDVGSSVRAGDRVVTRGNERLANGQPVAAKQQEYTLP